MFLVGPNASGKSNFLDAFRFLRDLASTGGGFQEAVGRRGGVTALRCLAARRYPDVTIGIVAEADSEEWKYELSFYQDNQRRPVVRAELVHRDKETLLTRPTEEDKADPARLTQTYLEQVNVNQPFRSLAAFLASIRYLKYQHWRPQGAWQTEEQFSDGTLRLMGLLWVALDSEGPLLLEEPELWLRPEIVRLLPQLLARVQRRTGRQIFLSTHSPDLLRDDGIGLDEVLLLRPGTEGTEVTPASSQRDIQDLLEGGLSIADIVIPKTRPDQASQLSLFGEV